MPPSAPPPRASPKLAADRRVADAAAAEAGARRRAVQRRASRSREPTAPPLIGSRPGATAGSRPILPPRARASSTQGRLFQARHDPPGDRRRLVDRDPVGLPTTGMSVSSRTSRRPPGRPDPPLARLGPALAGSLSGLILEDDGRLQIRLGWWRRRRIPRVRGAARPSSESPSDGSPPAPPFSARMSSPQRSSVGSSARSRDSAGRDAGDRTTVRVEHGRGG